ncbi:MAG: hypothetical protein WD468_09460 [Pirellulales bacterium]
MRRPRLHNSSIVIGLVLSVLLALVMIPGRIVHGTPSTWMTFEHGWPFDYLRREVQGNAPSPPFFMYRGWNDDLAERPMWGIPWLAAANWRLWEATVDDSAVGHKTAHWQFDIRLLLIDLAVTLLVFVFAVATWEIRRRRRPSFYAFNLADMLLAVACVSGLLGWMTHLKDGCRREYELSSRSLDDLESWWFSADESCVAPVWVRSLIGENLLPEFTWRVRSVTIDADGQIDVAQLVAQLSEFAYLNRINLSGTKREPNFRLSWLNKLSGVKHLEFTSGWCSDQRQFEELMQLNQLQKIVLWDKESVEPRILSDLQTALPHCQIVDFYDDW